MELLASSKKTRNKTEKKTFSRFKKVITHHPPVECFSLDLDPSAEIQIRYANQAGSPQNPPAPKFTSPLFIRQGHPTTSHTFRCSCFLTIFYISALSFRISDPAHFHLLKMNHGPQKSFTNIITFLSKSGVLDCIV